MWSDVLDTVHLRVIESSSLAKMSGVLAATENETLPKPETKENFVN